MILQKLKRNSPLLGLYHNSVRTVNFYEWILEHLRDPNPIIIYGEGMGRGKTDYSLLLASMMIDHGLARNILTNIKITDSNGYTITMVEDNITLKKMMNKIRARKVLVLDEAGLIINARRSMTNKNMYFMELIRFSRKKKTKFILVTHRFWDIDSAIRDIAILIARKDSKKHATLYSNKYSEDELRVIPHTNIPRSPIKFDTNQIPRFIVFDEEDEAWSEVLEKIKKIYYDMTEIDKQVIEAAIECNGSLECIQHKTGISRNNAVKKIAKILRRVTQAFQAIEEVNEE